MDEKVGIPPADRRERVAGGSDQTVRTHVGTTDPKLALIHEAARFPRLGPEPFRDHSLGILGAFMSPPQAGQRRGSSSWILAKSRAQEMRAERLVPDDAGTGVEVARGRDEAGEPIEKLDPRREGLAYGTRE